VAALDAFSGMAGFLRHVVRGRIAHRHWLLAASAHESQAWLKKEMRVWKAQSVWKTFGDKWARDVAFDVYLDQEVPDCYVL
jgi:polar amino acid transport system substrate-binding protein